MGNEDTVFRCPCCNGVFSIVRLNGWGPFKLEQTIRYMRGKYPLTDEEREWRKLEGKGRGSGHGKIEYDDWQEPSSELRQAFARRIKEVVELYG